MARELLGLLRQCILPGIHLVLPPKLLRAIHSRPATTSSSVEGQAEVRASEDHISGHPHPIQQLMAAVSTRVQQEMRSYASQAGQYQPPASTGIDNADYSADYHEVLGWLPP